MDAKRQVRDSGLLDALEITPTRQFSGRVWRVVRTGRDPCQGSASGGRWDDRTFDVLYTSLKREGALAEMYFHLSKGQPVIPSKVTYSLYELEVILSSCLSFEDLAALAQLGMDTTVFGQLSYSERQAEYPRSQDIAEHSHFLGHHGILVPNARWSCQNAVIFTERVAPEHCQVAVDHGAVDWNQWRRGL